MKKRFLLICLGLLAVMLAASLVSQSAYATHNRAGEITYRHAPVDGQDYRFEFTVITYTNTLGQGVADRDSIVVEWGDQSSSTLARVNGLDSDTNGVPNGELIGNGIRKNEYEAVHVYPGFAPYYVISMRDPNRNEGIININNGNSVEIEFYLEDTLFVLNPQFFGFNSSPILGLPPIDFAQVGYPFIHNPTAFDPDGDSLHFELIFPLESQGNTVLNYQFPDQIVPGPDNNISLDAQTGEFIWDSPQLVEEYNIAFLISEYRSGIKIGTMIRDMQIIVRETGNTPPQIAQINDTCILIGDTLQLEFNATDMDIPSQQVTMTAFGAPFELDLSPATFQADNGLGQSTGFLNWNTVCDHVFSDEYIVVIKAEDNFVFGNSPLPLTDLETWQITVVAPAPTGLTAKTEAGEIILEWDDPYVCADASKFIGFSVWRAAGCDSIEFDFCQQGLAGTNYTKIGSLLQDYTFVDETANKGLRYSYRVVAEFADANNSVGFPINVSESQPSNIACAELPKDEPIITHVSVENTDPSNGSIYVEWSKPKAGELDTIVNIPPYTYEVYRSADRDGGAFNKVASFVANSFAEANDTTFVDTGLNTSDQVYSYQIRFLASGDDEVGRTEIASSVFIEIAAASNQLNLSWNERVPWVNLEYTIFRRDAPSLPFDSIGLSTVSSYIDEDLTNGREYCYYIKSRGSYFSSALVDPLINFSQEECGIPIDTIPPCPPELTVRNDCDEDGEPGGDFDSNMLSWLTPESICGDLDVITYYVYFAPPFSADYELIDTLSENNYLHFLDNTLTGCYAVTAIDSFQNESAFSNEVCKESCLIYELPNAFTPNGDSQNDLFTPRAGYRFVGQVDFQVFNRWGNVVFETTDPELNWDGTDFKNGKDLPEDTYFYTCKVFELGFGGGIIFREELSGYIELFRDYER